MPKEPPRFHERGGRLPDRLATKDSRALRSGRSDWRSFSSDQSFIYDAWVGNLDGMKNGAYWANVNAQDPDTGATALHYAAAMRARAIINWLAKRKDIDYLIRDNEGRLPSTLAYEVASDPVIGRFLVKKECEQARARGIDYRTLLEP